MVVFLSYTIEFLIILPGMLLAYLPMKQYIYMRPRILTAVVAPFTLILCLAGAILYSFLHVKTIWLLFPITGIAWILYIHTLHVTRWKSSSVFLAVYGTFSCLGSVANAISNVLCPGNSCPWYSTVRALIWNLLCWIFVIIAWYPATHEARELLENEYFAQTWYVFWILPLFFIGLNLFLLPVHPELLLQGRSMQLYTVNSLALLFLLNILYLLFYFTASNLNRSDQLRHENQFLIMQQAQYNNLCNAIAETREARHDMRHHFSTLQNLARRQEWEKLEIYLSNVLNEIPDVELNLCDNTAVDGIASHYGLLCLKKNIIFSSRLDLPQKLPVPETGLCLVLSNLLENALEASLKTDPAKRYIKTQAYLHSDHMVLLTVENAFDGTICEKNGVFQSSKRRGEGIGLQSVRRIAEKNGGYCRFIYEDGIFCANVMFRSDKRSITHSAST